MQIFFSKTFTDAIFIARGLGLSYLWVECLCIIQDDKDDWENESGLMATVYGNSYIKNTASSAADGRQGCFQDQDFRFLQSVLELCDFTKNRLSRQFQSGSMILLSLTLPLHLEVGACKSDCLRRKRYISIEHSCSGNVTRKLSANLSPTTAE
jgi:hypothetical protein